MSKIALPAIANSNRHGLTLGIDDGLMAYLRATSDGFVYGDINETAVALIRNALRELLLSDPIRKMIIGRLPEPYRSAWKVPEP